PIRPWALPTAAVVGMLPPGCGIADRPAGSPRRKAAHPGYPRLPVLGLQPDVLPRMAYEGVAVLYEPLDPLGHRGSLEREVEVKVVAVALENHVDLAVKSDPLVVVELTARLIDQGLDLVDPGAEQAALVVPGTRVIEVAEQDIRVRAARRHVGVHLPWVGIVRQV